MKCKLYLRPKETQHAGCINTRRTGVLIKEDIFGGVPEVVVGNLFFLVYSMGISV